MQKRVRRLNSAGARQFPHQLNPFIAWFESLPILTDLRDELLRRAPPKVFSEDLQMVLSGQAWVPDTELEAAALGHALISHLAANPNTQLLRVMNRYGGVDEGL